MYNEQTNLNTVEVALLPPPKSITDTALSYMKSGLSVIPTSVNKIPTLKSWKHLQTNKPHLNEVTSWWPDNTGSIGIICGQISGNLEVIDFDEKYNVSNKPILALWKTLVELERPGLTDKLVMQRTQNNGYHALYRCNTIQGNNKLAQRSATEAELIVKPDEKSKTLIETRGEKGYILCYPSSGYSVFNGDLTKIPEITSDERDILISCARSLNQYFSPTSIVTDKAISKNMDPALPGNDFSKRGDHKQWLEKHGWTFAGEVDDNERWRRPGKREGVSATFRKSDGMFYVFSSNAGPFEQEKAYNKFAMYTQLEADGDYKQAAKNLALLGFGELKSSSKEDEKYIETENYLLEHYDFRRNLITARIEMKLKHETEYYKMEDVQLNSIYRDLKIIKQSLGKDGLHMLLNSDFTPEYDPFTEYFDSLPEWDGSNDHIAELVDTLTFNSDPEKKLFIKYFKRWLVGVVACAIDPQSVNQSSIILVGEQGMGKSRWLNHLVPIKLTTYKFIGTIDPKNKDSQIYLSECLLINLDELETLKSSKDIGELKSLMTLPSVKVRRPYDRLPVDMVRRASFVGSINNSDFLNDPTGSRRFLVFDVTGIQDFHKIDMDKVYSQVKALWRAGERFWFTDSEIKEITERNKQYALRTYEHELVNEMCKPGDETTGIWMTSTGLAEQIQIRRPKFTVDKGPVRNIGYALTAEGYEKKCSKGSAKYLIAWKGATDIDQ